LTGASFGFVNVAVGAAIVASYSHLGLSVRGIGGTLAAAAGGASLIVGALLALPTFGRWRRLLAIPIFALSAYVIGLPVAVAVFATNVGRPSLGDVTPADRDLGFIDASFTTEDGVRLSGWYLPSTNRAAVVLLHGASSTRSAVLDHAAVLAQHGYGVLLYDARGMGGSGGRAMNLGWYGDLDVSAAVDHLTSRSDVDPNRIGVVGMSMGGEQAIGAMAADTRIRAVVAEGATNRVSGDWKWLSDEYGIRGFASRGVHWLTERLTDFLTDAAPPMTLREAVATASPRPALLIAAGRVSGEIHAGHYIQEGAPTSVELWIVPGADHTDGLRTQPTEWEERVTEFLDAALQ
jgi:pimeloyl-ACP methyl ester carboxylesterase